MVIIPALLLLPGLALGQPTKPPGSEECCLEKTVGGVRYLLVGTDSDGQITKELDCLSPCVFAEEGKPESKFCFARGDMKVECKDDMKLTPPPRPTTAPPPPAGAASGSNSSTGCECAAVPGGSRIV